MGLFILQELTFADAPSSCIGHGLILAGEPILYTPAMDFIYPSAATTASPISEQETLRQPSLMMSPVRMPSESTF